jgi:hypothetical protein
MAERLRCAAPTSLIPYRHSRAPEVQTTGDTTPVQQIVYAVSLTTSGGSSAKDGTELRQKGCGCGFSAVTVTGLVTPLSAFHFSICSSNDLSDFSTARSLLTPSIVSENETHCICAAAIVQGVLQQTTAISTMVGRIYSNPRSGFPLKAKESPKKPNWLSRRHSWNCISGRITSTDDNLRLRHAYRLDELVESGCV